MNGTCETCKHWLKASERTGYGDAITLWPRSSEWEDDRTVDRLYGECQVILLQDDWDRTKPVPLATVRDASDYQATLFTQAGFGCAMHEGDEG